jgi:hypothetical protein
MQVLQLSPKILVGKKSMGASIIMKKKDVLQLALQLNF